VRRIGGGGEGKGGDWERRGAADWEGVVADLDFFTHSPDTHRKKEARESDGNKRAWLPPITGPAYSWSHASWTRSEDAYVRKNLTASDGSREKRAQKFTVSA
jgi:hypothetical protein